jgi:hypothetical protein
MRPGNVVSATRRALLVCAAVLAAACSVVPGTATAKPSIKKSIWGPAQVDGRSQFPIYADLGAGIYQTTLNWNLAGVSRPARPTDPKDPAYSWPEELDFVVKDAARYGIRVSLLVHGSPNWANGGHEPRWQPSRVEDLADFVTAAARRYPSVHLWMIWGEPSRRQNFFPLFPETRGKPLTKRQALAPRYYARMLDASYGALKGVSKKNLVIGGNTFTVGDISPRNWIRYMKLPNGKPPRMDLYGHNPFSARKPDLRNPAPTGPGAGFADFSDLGRLAGWLDKYQRRGKRRLPLFLSEFFFPTDHQNHEFPFYVTRKTQANWLAAALRITRSWSRIYTLGWFSLYDDPPRPKGDEVNRGLIDIKGNRKPSYYAYRRG